MHEINFQMFTGQSIISMIHFIFVAALLCQAPQNKDYFIYTAIRFLLKFKTGQSNKS